MLTKYFLWAGLLAIAILLSQEIQKTQEKIIPVTEKAVLTQSLLAFWDIQKNKTYILNKLAEDYIVKNKLAPNDPLPPNTFYAPNDPLLGLLTKNTRLEITTTYTAKSNLYTSKCASLLTIAGKVPTPPEKYAYCGILWSSYLTSSSSDYYPKDSHGFARLLEANHRIETDLSKNNLSP